MNGRQKRALHGLVNAALSFNPLEEIRISLEPGRPDQEHAHYFHIRGRWRAQFDKGRIETQEHGNYYDLTYDEMRVVLTEARTKVGREQNKCRREQPKEDALTRAALSYTPPYAYWQPINDAIHAPKDNHKLRVFEATLRQVLVTFDPCKPIELVRDGEHYSAKKKPPPHLFIKGWHLDPPPQSNGLNYYDPYLRQHIDRIDDYEAAYAIVEEVLSEFRRVGLVKALLRGIDCNPKGTL